MEALWPHLAHLRSVPLMPPTLVDLSQYFVGEVSLATRTLERARQELDQRAPAGPVRRRLERVLGPWHAAVQQLSRDAAAHRDAWHRYQSSFQAAQDALSLRQWNRLTSAVVQLLDAAHAMDRAVTRIAAESQRLDRFKRAFQQQGAGLRLHRDSSGARTEWRTDRRQWRGHLPLLVLTAIGLTLSRALSRLPEVIAGTGLLHVVSRVPMSVLLGIRASQSAFLGLNEVALPDGESRAVPLQVRWRSAAEMTLASSAWTRALTAQETAEVQAHWWSIDPELLRAFAPKHEIVWNGRVFYLSTPYIASLGASPAVVVYVSVRDRHTGRPTMAAWLVQKELARNVWQIIWRVVQEGIERRPATDAPLELAAAFEALYQQENRRVIIARNGYAGLLIDQAAWLEPMSAISIDTFTRRGDPRSFVFRTGYEPDLVSGVRERFVSSSPRLHRHVRSFRVLSANREVQYLMHVAGIDGQPRAWIGAVQSTTFTMTPAGLRSVAVAVEADFTLPASAYYRLIPAGYRGAQVEEGAPYFDASSFTNALPDMAGVRRVAADNLPTDGLGPDRTDGRSARDASQRTQHARAVLEYRLQHIERRRGQVVVAARSNSQGQFSGKLNAVLGNGRLGMLLLGVIAGALGLALRANGAWREFLSSFIPWLVLGLGENAERRSAMSRRWNNTAPSSAQRTRALRFERSSSEQAANDSSRLPGIEKSEILTNVPVRQSVAVPTFVQLPAAFVTAVVLVVATVWSWPDLLSLATGLTLGQEPTSYPQRVSTASGRVELSTSPFIQDPATADLVWQQALRELSRTFPEIRGLVLGEGYVARDRLETQLTRLKTRVSDAHEAPLVIGLEEGTKVALEPELPRMLQQQFGHHSLEIIVLSRDAVTGTWVELAKEFLRPHGLLIILEAPPHASIADWHRVFSSPSRDGGRFHLTILASPPRDFFLPVTTSL